MDSWGPVEWGDQREVSLKCTPELAWKPQLARPALEGRSWFLQPPSPGPDSLQKPRDPSSVLLVRS